MAYNNSITTILSTLSHQLNSTEPQKALSVVFGTHNPESCDLVTSNLVKYGLASQVEGSTLLALRDDVVGKVFVAQLYGMSPSPSFRRRLMGRNERWFNGQNGWIVPE
jgi:proline dehydrogenase